MWSALAIVYVLWGGTYVAIRVMVEDIPPLLGAGARFAIAGVAMLGFLAARGHRVRVAPRSLAAAGLVGLLLPAGGNGLVTVAERDVPAGLAALLIASVPLWVVLLRSTVGGERVNRGDARRRRRRLRAAWRCCCSPAAGRRTSTVGGVLLVLVAACSWAIGSFLSPRLSMPSDPLVSTGWQMVVGGAAMLAGALAAGEAGDLHLGERVGQVAARVRLPRRRGLAGGLHRLRVAAAERADLEGRDLRVRQPAGRRPAGLGAA